MTGQQRDEWARKREAPEIVVTQHRRWWWSVRLDCGLTDYMRDDGGPHAFTRARAERKGQRLLRSYRRMNRSLPEFRIPS